MGAAAHKAAALAVAAGGRFNVAAEPALAGQEWPPCTLQDCSLCLSSRLPEKQNLTILSPDSGYRAAPFRIGRLTQTWDSHAIFATIIGILVTERLHIAVEYGECYDTATCYLAVNNCINWANLQCDLIETMAEAERAVQAGTKLWPDLLSDLMFVPEVYQSDISSQTFAGTQLVFDERPGVATGTTGYTARDGVYMYPGIVESARKDGLDVLWLDSLRSPLSLKYLATPGEVMAAGVDAELSGCSSDLEAVNASMTEHLDLGWACNASWWLNPACAQKGGSWASTCLAMFEDDWGYVKPDLTRGVAASAAPVAKLFVGYGPWHSLLTEKAHSVLFTWWTPDSTLRMHRPRRVALFPELDAREVVLLKAAWRPALDASAQLAEVVTNAHLDNKIMDGLMSQVAAGYASGGLGAPLYQKVACEWLRGNKDTWTEWLPGVRSCTQGQFFSEASGSCERCEVGRYATAFRNGTKFCKRCDAGRFTGKEGMLSCDACPGGQYQPEEGQSTCAACEEGTSQALAGLTACGNCTAGSASPVVGALQCMACPAGTSARAGAVECRLCGVGSFAAAAGSGVCAACPGQLTTAGRGAASAGECVCPAGSYRPSDDGGTAARGACLACPEGLQCPVGSDVDVPRSMSVVPGYMTRVQDPLQVFKCVSVLHCPGGSPGTCAPYRSATSVACGECEPGAFERDSVCVPCDKVSIMPIVLVTCAGFVGISLAYFLMTSKRVGSQTRTQIVLVVMFGLAFSSLQTLCVINSLDIVWPEPLRTIFQALGTLTFDLKVLRVSCMVRTSPATTFIARQSVPIIPVPLIALVLLLRKGLRPRTEFLVDLLNTVGAIFSVFFISILMNCTVPLVCYPHPAGNGESVLTNPSILCFQSADHKVMVAAGALSLFAVPVPFLAFSIYGIARYPYHAARALPSNVRWLRQFQFMFARYTPEAYYYSILLLARNCLICVVPILLKSPATQICATCVVISALILAQQQIRPWRSRLANFLDGFLGLAIVNILLCGAMASSQRAQATSIALLGVSIVSVLGLAVVAGIAVSLIWYLRAGPKYDCFICHHKLDAQAQARLLKIRLRAARRRVFLDSDDLLDLQGLFDIVRGKMRTLVVYLTRCTLMRPWCAGEITTAFAAGRQVVAVRTPSFERPSEAHLEDLHAYIDLTGCNLAEHGLTLASVAEAFRRLLGDGTPQVAMLADGLSGQRIRWMMADLEGALSTQRHNAAALLSRRASFPSPAQTVTFGGGPGSSPASEGPARRDMFVISAHPRCDEAWAAAAALVSYILQDVLSTVRGGLANLADRAEDERFVEGAVAGARAAVVVLGPDTMQCIEQLQVMAALMEACQDAGTVREAAPAVIPLSIPGFEFPSAGYYENVLPKVWPEDGPSVAGYLKAFFKIIGIGFPTGVSDQMMAAQSRQVLARIPSSSRKILTLDSIASTRSAVWSTPSTRSGGDVAAASDTLNSPEEEPGDLLCTTSGDSVMQWEDRDRLQLDAMCGAMV